MVRLNKYVRSVWLQALVVASLVLGAAMVLTPMLLPATTESSTYGPGPKADVPGISPDLSQVEALADGLVTRAEYDAAVDRTIACVEGSGAEVLEKRYEEFRTAPVWTYLVKDPASRYGVASAYDECWLKYERDVQAAWVAQHEPSASESAENAEKALECARQEGLRASSVEELLALPRIAPPANVIGYSRCMTIAFKGYDPHERAPDLDPTE